MKLDVYYPGSNFSVWIRLNAAAVKITYLNELLWVKI